jgi:pimeloyl-ACP methyl ester carboxylesterase
VLEAGFASTAATWSKVQPEVAKFARVVAYDRAGLGTSEALDAYERSLKDSPGRLNGLSGPAHAAQLAGDREKALLATNTR